MVGAYYLSVFASIASIVIAQDPNYTNHIEPDELAAPSTLIKVGTIKRQVIATTGQRLEKQSCTKNSWTGGEVLTKPANNIQVVVDSVTGPGSLIVTKQRTQSWTTNMSIGIADILSFGVSPEFSESVSSDSPMFFEIAAGQSGGLGFTATMSCSTGKGQCDGSDVEGEVCCKLILLHQPKL
jgi:hypothetical protein